MIVIIRKEKRGKPRPVTPSREANLKGLMPTEPFGLDLPTVETLD